MSFISQLNLHKRQSVIKNSVIRTRRLESTDITWISTCGGRFIVLSDSLLSDWHGCPDDADPLDTSHDYGRACATSGYSSTLRVGAGNALIFGENKLGGVWLRRSLPILFEWVYANDENAVIAAMDNLPNDPTVDDTTDFTVDSDSLVVFDSVSTGLDFEPRHSCRFSVPVGRYIIGSTYFKPDDETGLILHRFLPA